MEEADTLLLVQLKQLGIQLNNLEDFEAESMCQCVVICFERMYGMLSEEDQFIDLKALKRCNLREPTGRFKACQKFTEYLKHLGYFYNLSFNVFLFPNKKETRQLLGFLFEMIFREENASQAKKK